jgi:hypothetical protein
MPRIKVSIAKFDGTKFIQTQIASIRELADRQIEAIADETVKVIRQKITARIDKRDGSTENLALSFTKIPITGGFGVGDINFLNKQAPYWYWQNFGIAQSGRKIPPANRGAFTSGNPKPNPAGGTSRWGHSSTGKYLIQPKKPIEAKHYIEATINEINQIIQTVIRSVK